MLNIEEVKKDFPILTRKVEEKPLVYLDNAATSQKPQCVIDAMSNFYALHNSNVHRGLHTLSEEATDMFENARETVATFIGAKTNEIIFTSGATESLNLVAYGYVIPRLQKGDVLITTKIEHHSNLVPWQEAVIATGAELRILDFSEEGDISLKELEELLDENVKFVAVTHSSNVLGNNFPIKEISKLAHQVGAKVIVDGAQAVPHMPVNVQSLDCDFYAFSGHKMLGPMGIGVLWGKPALLEEMTPMHFGGGMINKVETHKSTWAPVPDRFEGGTPNVAGAIGLSVAVSYLSNLGMSKIRDYEENLISYAMERLKTIPGLFILGTKHASKRGGLVSFVIDGIHAHDIASVLSAEGIAVRSGHHCTMPLHKELKVNSSTRASFYIYNDKADVDSLINGLKKAVKLLG